MFPNENFSTLFVSKPKFLDSHVKVIVDGWEDTKQKAQARLELLNNTKNAWLGYASGLENIAIEFEKSEEEIKKIKKRFHLQNALDDLEKRQKIFNDTKNTIEGMNAAIQSDYDVMTMTLPEDKKDFVKKEVKAVQAKLEVIGRFEEKVKKIENFVNNLQAFDKTLKFLDTWMVDADVNINKIKNDSHQMTPEDRVSLTMELQEDVAAKVQIIKQNIAQELELLPQGIFFSEIFTCLNVKPLIPLPSQYETFFHRIFSSEHLMHKTCCLTAQIFTLSFFAHTFVIAVSNPSNHFYIYPSTHPPKAIFFNWKSLSWLFYNFNKYWDRLNTLIQECWNITILNIMNIITSIQLWIK